MNGRPVETVVVDEHDDGVRVDRWIHRHRPSVPYGTVQKWLRSGQVRVDGHRCRPGDRLKPGQRVRVPPVAEAGGERVTAPVPAAAAAELERRVLYRDSDLIVLDKPRGLAVQGGTAVRQSIDGMLGALRDGGERPRLVHRLDKDTSGVLVLARHAGAAAELTRAFRHRSVLKLYWALVVGAPRPREGDVTLPLRKSMGAKGERMAVDEDGGRPAVTRYRSIAHAGRQATWLALQPLTGRTHQLRAHCAALATPILGDAKYGGRTAFLDQLGDVRFLHLHARAVGLPGAAGRLLTVRAPLPDDMLSTMRLLGFPAAEDDRRSDAWLADD